MLLGASVELDIFQTSNSGQWLFSSQTIVEGPYAYDHWRKHFEGCPACPHSARCQWKETPGTPKAQVSEGFEDLHCDLCGPWGFQGQEFCAQRGADRASCACGASVEVPGRGALCAPSWHEHCGVSGLHEACHRVQHVHVHGTGKFEGNCHSWNCWNHWNRFPIFPFCVTHFRFRWPSPTWRTLPSSDPMTSHWACQAGPAGRAVAWPALCPLCPPFALTPLSEVHLSLLPSEAALHHFHSHRKHLNWPPPEQLQSRSDSPLEQKQHEESGRICQIDRF